MSNIVIGAVARLLEADLAPLSSAHHNNADISVSSEGGAGVYTLVVRGPEHVRIMVPTKYHGLPVRFEAVDPNSLFINFQIDISHVRTDILE